SDLDAPRTASSPIRTASKEPASTGLPDFFPQVTDNLQIPSRRIESGRIRPLSPAALARADSPWLSPQQFTVPWMFRRDQDGKLFPSAPRLRRDRRDPARGRPGGGRPIFDRLADRARLPIDPECEAAR